MPSLFILNVTLIETKLERAEGRGRGREGKARGKRQEGNRPGSYYESTTLGLVIKVLPIDFGEHMLRYHPCDAGERVGRVGR